MSDALKGFWIGILGFVIGMVSMLVFVTMARSIDTVSTVPKPQPKAVIVPATDDDPVVKMYRDDKNDVLCYTVMTGLGSTKIALSCVSYR